MLHRSILSAAVLAAFAAPALADDVTSFSDAFAKGKFSIDSRIRYEAVDDDALSRDASALTWRNRLGFRTAPWQGFSAFVELEDVRALEQQFNSTANGRSQYPTVADPEGSEWNQVGIAFDSGHGCQVVIGRQRLALDNQRLIGNVGWRQNEQTFDAASLTHTFADKTVLRYAYLQDVHRVFGNGNPNPRLAEFDLDGHVFNVSHPFTAGTLVGYGYWVDNEDLPATATATLGLRFTGNRALSDPWKLVYAAEWAQQSDWRDAVAIDADYQLLELGLARGAITGKITREVLEGDGRSAFQSPLATLHAFNGWADKFLTTPVNGLVDDALSLAGPWSKATWQLAWHDYHSDRGNTHYGSEWNASISLPFATRYTALLKYASYDADHFARNTDKLWLSLEYKY